MEPHPLSRVLTHPALDHLGEQRPDFEEALRWGQIIADKARQYGDWPGVSEGHLIMGDCMGRAGDLRGGMDYVQQGLERLIAIGYTHIEWWFCLAANLSLSAGRLQRAQEWAVRFQAFYQDLPIDTDQRRGDAAFCQRIIGTVINKVPWTSIDSSAASAARPTPPGNHQSETTHGEATP